MPKSRASKSGARPQKSGACYESTTCWASFICCLYFSETTETRFLNFTPFLQMQKLRSMFSSSWLEAEIHLWPPYSQAMGFKSSSKDLAVWLLLCYLFFSEGREMEEGSFGIPIGVAYSWTSVFTWDTHKRFKLCISWSRMKENVLKYAVAKMPR